jgi:hypothetical protein
VAVITPIVQAFANAPGPPDGPGPVRLHVELDDPIPENTTTALVPCTVPAASGQADYDLLKKQFFGTAAERSSLPTKPNVLNAKALAFRYGMSVHNLAPTGNTTSGCSEIGGNDFVMSLGSWTSVKQPDGTSHNVGTTDQQTGTLLHELGHTIGLRHGGGDNVNCKPNYPSVMSYTLQFSSTVPGRPLDYSRQVLGITLPGGVIGLDKSQLNELLGVGGYNGKVAFGPVPNLGKPTVAAGASAINWNNSTSGAVDISVNRDINQTTNASGGCPANQGTDLTGTSTGTILRGYKDWANLQFNFWNLDYGDGAHDSSEAAVGEIRYDETAAMSRDVIDIKPNDPNNTISSNASPTIDVAIFSRLDDSVVPPQVELDATDIDPATLLLKGTGAATWTVSVKQNPNGKFQCNTRDVNHDGLPDLVCGFTIPKNTLSSGETQAVLEGLTSHGQHVLGLDAIRVVP